MNEALPNSQNLPHCVDLDGTLLLSDLLYESVVGLLRDNPFYLLLFPVWLLKGKAHLKRKIAERVSVAPELLPYDARVLELLRSTTSRPRVLCTASDEQLARPIANHLGLFEEVLASDGETNLGGRTKARALTARFGARGFDYMGNGWTDIHVWRHARNAWVVNGTRSLARAAGSVANLSGHFPLQGGSIRDWIRAIRVHQWLKNLLVLVPLLAAHKFADAGPVAAALLAVLAFSLCASGVYVLNDLLDLPADRQHLRKRTRPFASGRVPILHGLLAAPLLTLAGFAIAWQTGPRFALVLGLYYLLTLAYSLRLKQFQMLDVTVLAGLYTLRIIGGAMAIDVPLSFWLLAFSMFIFLSLAMLKRYIELHGLLASGRQHASGRGYRTDDLPLMQSLGGASGYIAVLVLALYINSPESLALYSRPQVLWLLCPLLLYWVGRAWAIAHRGGMHDDPVVFAATDRGSQIVALLCVLLIFGAS